MEADRVNEQCEVCRANESCRLPAPCEDWTCEGFDYGGNDMISKKSEKPAENEPVVIMPAEHADKMVCRLCGKNYISSGKRDPGFCRECLQEMDEENAMLIGGPLDGQKAHE